MKTLTLCLGDHVCLTASSVCAKIKGKLSTITCGKETAVAQMKKQTHQVLKSMTTFRIQSGQARRPANEGPQGVSSQEGKKGEGGEENWTLQQLGQSQERDPDNGPIIELMKSNEEQPRWSTIAAESATTKAYLAQWRTLRLQDRVLYRLWISPTDDT